MAQRVVLSKDHPILSCSNPALRNLDEGDKLLDRLMLHRLEYPRQLVRIIQNPVETRTDFDVPIVAQTYPPKRSSFEQGEIGREFILMHRY